MKIFRKLSILLIAAGLAFTSCSDISESEEEKTNSGTARISLELGLRPVNGTESESTSARTVMANAEDNKAVSNLKDIKLYAKTSGSSASLGTNDTLLASWTSYSELQTTPYSEDVTSGTYDFMLSAKNYGATMTQTISGKSISAGSKVTLNFNSLAPSSDGEQTGAFYVQIYHGSSYGVSDSLKKYIEDNSSPYPEISISLDGKNLVTKDSSKSVLSKATDSDGNTYETTISSIMLSSDHVSAGFHIVTFTFTADDSSVLVYPIPVYVEAGYLSKKTFYGFTASSVTQDSNATSCTVTYNSNTTSPVTKTQSFYEGSSIADADALGFTSDSASKRFKEWNTAANGSGTSYKAGETPALTGDITLYAQWASFTKVTYFINLGSRTETYIQQFEAGDSLVAETTAFKDADLTYSSQTQSKKLNLTFCGWDTEADGNGTRYAGNERPTLAGDTILYAQWCGAKLHAEDNPEYSFEGCYEVYNLKHWNALMGLPFANTTSGTLSADVVFGHGESSQALTLANPALKHTSGKTFSGKIKKSLYANSVTISGLTAALFDSIAEGSEINNISVKGPLCNTNNGTITLVTVSGVSMTGWAAIAKENTSTGTISNCSVSNCTITGSKTGNDDGYAGVICNKNYGTIEGCSVSNCTLDGKTNSLKYTGGITGYNAGTISGSGSVDITLSGCEDTDCHYGYVIGAESSSAKTSTEITTNASEPILDTGTIVVDKYERFEITLERTSLVKVTFTDTNANGAQVNGYLSSQKIDGKPSAAYIIEEDINETSITRKVYLEKGTYYVYLTENFWKKNDGCSAKVTID